MRLYLFTFLFVSFAFLTSCTSSKKLNETYVNTLQKTSFLSDFSVLSTPREKIGIGSQWIKGQGPDGSGMNSEMLITSKSLSDYDFQQDNKLGIDVKLNILTYLGLKANYQTSKDCNLKIDGAEIVRIKDLSSLHFSEGKTFLYEGIRVDSISLTTSKERVDTISFALNKIGKIENISPSQTLDNRNKLFIRGLNLFIAYRLVKFGEITTKTNGREQVVTEKTGRNKYFIGKVIGEGHEDDIHVSHRLPRLSENDEEMSGFKIGNKYEGRIYSAGELNQKFSDIEISAMINLNKSNNCKLSLVIDCYTEIINGRPKQLLYHLNCLEDNREEIIIALDSKILDDFYLLEELRMTIPDYKLRKDNPYPTDITDNYGIGRTSLQYRQIKIPIVTIYDKSAPGW